MDTVKRSALQYTHNVAAIRAKLDDCVYHNEQTNLKEIAALVGLSTQAAATILTQMLMFDIEEGRSDFISMYAFITRRTGAEQGIPGPWYWNTILPNWKGDGVSIPNRQCLASTARNSAHNNRINWFCKPVGELLANIDLPKPYHQVDEKGEELKAYANLIVKYLMTGGFLGELLEDKPLRETIAGAKWQNGLLDEVDRYFLVGFKRLTLEVAGYVDPVTIEAKGKSPVMPTFVIPGPDNASRGQTFATQPLHEALIWLGFDCINDVEDKGRKFTYATLAPLPITLTFSFPNGWGFKIDPVEQQA